MDGAVTEDSCKALPRCVLLVEDNVILVMNIQDMLTEIGIEEVLHAATVAEALELVEAHVIDFAILDFDLGGEKSTPVASALRAATIPFVFASGYGAQLALPPDLADSAVLMKPYMITDIEKAIERR